VALKKKKQSLRHFAAMNFCMWLPAVTVWQDEWEYVLLLKPDVMDIFPVSDLVQDVPGSKRNQSIFSR